MSDATCCHCRATAPMAGDAMPAGWRMFTTSADQRIVLCGECRQTMLEDFIFGLANRIAALEAAMVTVRDIMHTDAPASAPYPVMGKGVIN